MFSFFQKKISLNELAQRLALQLHHDLGETEDQAREAFGEIDIPLGGHGFDAAMTQVRYAQVQGLVVALESRLESAVKKAEASVKIKEACLEVGYLRDDEIDLFEAHAQLYARVLDGLGSGDGDRDRALLGIQFSDFLVADRNPALVIFGTALFSQSADLVDNMVKMAKIV